MADFKISDLDAYPNNQLQSTDLLEVSWDDSGTFKSRKVTPDKLRLCKVYVANITQTGTSAPTADVFENTLGGTPTFSRTGAGDYDITLTGAWKADKTFIVINNFPKQGLAKVSRVTEDVINLATYNTSFTQVDAILEDTSIEIRVYP